MGALDREKAILAEMDKIEAAIAPVNDEMQRLQGAQRELLAALAAERSEAKIGDLVEWNAGDYKKEKVSRGRVEAYDLRFYGRHSGAPWITVRMVRKDGTLGAERRLYRGYRVIERASVEVQRDA